MKNNDSRICSNVCREMLWVQFKSRSMNSVCGIMLIEKRRKRTTKTAMEMNGVTFWSI